jgi:hypothetical protein
MKNSMRTALVLMLICVFALTGCSILSNAEKLETYELGADSIPAVNSVVGERNVTEVQSGTGTGGTYKEYAYESQTVTEDLIAYLIDGLLENNWHALTDFNLNDIPGTAQLATESEDNGQIIIMDVTYEQDAYTIKLTKGEGTLTLN